MAIQYATSLRNTLVDDIDAAIGAGGKLKIYSAAYGTLLATFEWTGTPFGAGSSGVITLAAPTTNPVTAAGTGTAAIAKFTTSADADVITGLTVGTSGTDIIINNASIMSGDNVSVTYASAQIIAPHA